MNIPKQTAEVFELLSRGQFLCSDSADDDKRRLYNVVDNAFEELSNYFAAIDFALEKGDEYFYFSRKETKADLERKIEQAYRWIDIVDFFKAFNNAFGAGFRFTPSDIEVQLRMDANLKDKLEALRRITGDGSYQERIKRIIHELVSYSYAELENEITQQHKVVASFKYIEHLIVSISISEEVQHEIPQ
jgi:hypothetical protein